MTDAGPRGDVRAARRWVVKTGSALVAGPSGRSLHTAALDTWARQISALRERGIEVIVVSSGSIAVGMATLNWQQRPDTLASLQAAAAVGQPGLANAWSQALQQHGAHGAQILLTRDDIEHATRSRNASATLRALLDLDVVPVVNENDTVATEQIQFGDNDTLAAYLVPLVAADLLVILTDQDGLHTADPRRRADATLIASARCDDPNLDRAAEPGTGRLGRGGMVSKLRAARIAAESGTRTVIANGMATDILLRLADGAEMGSLICPAAASSSLSSSLSS